MNATKPSVAALLLAFLLGGCGDIANLSIAESIGPAPELPAPTRTLFPTVHIAEATGWAEGGAPVAAQGLRVNAFATGLDHPRWLLALPNILTGFLSSEGQAMGRPVGVQIARDGSLLVADDVGNRVWRVSAD